MVDDTSFNEIAKNIKTEQNNELELANIRIKNVDVRTYVDILDD